MPFFPRFQYPQHSTFFPNDIFRLLDEAASNIDTSTDSPTARRGFSPNFDVHETEHEYVLEGELPGLSEKDKVNLEFTDEKTLYISGRIERSLKRFSDDQGRIQTIEGGEEPKKLTEEGEDKGKGKAHEGAQVEKKEQRPKYWVSERSIGEFSRSFSFPGPIDIDKVKASLEHGILKVVVPKMEKKQGRKIQVQ
ncbi:heat shock protein 30 [Ascodesmis nigricans]|uniref:Heat shock protein 30 n=1 Tax=Ascodesmis nigricans TaxID=341454 RepID=A0A4S2N1C2_9PEZI|nr:heat shock protein 30 [Ascodesmis nigricans]